MQFFQFQLNMLRSRIEADRIVPTPEKKAELLRLGPLRPHAQHMSQLRFVAPHPHFNGLICPGILEVSVKFCLNTPSLAHT